MSSRASAREADAVLRFAIVIEKARENYSAYVPDLPGCVATGDSLESTKKRAQEAIAFHLECTKTDFRFLKRGLWSRGLKQMAVDSAPGSIE